MLRSCNQPDDVNAMLIVVLNELIYLIYGQWFLAQCLKTPKTCVRSSIIL